MGIHGLAVASMDRFQRGRISFNPNQRQLSSHIIKGQGFSSHASATLLGLNPGAPSYRPHIGIGFLYD